ncbi:uncharacterized protein N7479_008054 [Penicillium vulpinum]|uniref:F-box domain-containing protein n=1 Tax=Penicillium vulpinum TaxID=29845 RepID=A0A1V6RBX0_9EURO|nr:uncharacterized protein N7479_008054 [Penicillium vulpinum]KAJ5960904.1 hypothetical protein N7479_008054 [Penicillium vulpinum]OQD99030.1 hypothetical protein PENVUL_c066G07534 [Penicillium vulpinum]
MESPQEHQSEPQTAIPTRSRLFTLPAEMRLQIFGYCVPHNCAIKVTNAMYRPYEVEPLVSTRNPSRRFSNTRPRWTNILQVSKEMSDQCLDILYGDNLFEVYLNRGGEATLRKTFGKENLQRIRYIIAIAPGPCFTGELNPPDIPFWTMMIPNLNRFEWVTQPEQKAEENRSDIMVKRGLEGWMEWQDAYLDCFGEFLVPKVQFRMRLDNGESEYRQLGNRVFRRGPFFNTDGQQI